MTEYQLHRLRCPGCGTTTRAALPPGGPPSWLGPAPARDPGPSGRRLSAGKRPIGRLAHDRFGQSISHGWLGSLERATARALAGPMAQALRVASGQPANVAETMARQPCGRGGVWVAVTAVCTAFLLRRSRGADALAGRIGLRPRRVITGVRLRTYDVLPVGKRQVCWAHLRRDFQALIDRGGAGAVVGRELLGLSDDLFFFSARGRDVTWSRSRFQEQLAVWQGDLRRQPVAGPACGGPRGGAMRRRGAAGAGALDVRVRDRGRADE